MDVRHTHRIFVPGALAENSVVMPNEAQTHHLLHVLRLKIGEVLRVFNGRHGEFRASVASIGKHDMQIAVHELLRAQKTDADLWLCCAPIKKTHFDFMIEKATELGVSEIQPLLTHRTQIREVNGDRAWSICREAAEQSERLTVPAVGDPVSLDDFIDVFPKDRVLVVCAELGEAAPVHQALMGQKKATKAAIVTGPEGGFAPEELEKLRTVTTAVLIRLGPRILRADTAALAALTCWQALRGDWEE